MITMGHNCKYMGINPFLFPLKRHIDYFLALIRQRLVCYWRHLCGPCYYYIYHKFTSNVAICTILFF